MARFRKRMLMSLFALAAALPSLVLAQVTCPTTEAVQFLSYGDFAPGSTWKIVCVVDYWACGRSYSKKSAPVENTSGSCDAFTRAATANIGNEACCDCFPNCGPGGDTTPPDSASESGTRLPGGGGNVLPSEPPPAPTPIGGGPLTQAVLIPWTPSGPSAAPKVPKGLP